MLLLQKNSYNIFHCHNKQQADFPPKCASINLYLKHLPSQAKKSLSQTLPVCSFKNFFHMWSDNVPRFIKSCCWPNTFCLWLWLTSSIHLWVHNSWESPWLSYHRHYLKHTALWRGICVLWGFLITLLLFSNGWFFKKKTFAIIIIIKKSFSNVVLW